MSRARERHATPPRQVSIRREVIEMTTVNSGHKMRAASAIFRPSAAGSWGKRRDGFCCNFDRLVLQLVCLRRRGVDKLRAEGAR
jgi:hypothetical protein